MIYIANKMLVPLLGGAVLLKLLLTGQKTKLSPSFTDKLTNRSAVSAFFCLKSCLLPMLLPLVRERLTMTGHFSMLYIMYQLHSTGETPRQ